MVTLYWRWADSAEHTERSAHYENTAAARAQAEHDLALCEAADDYSTAPVRIVDARGRTTWSAPIPDGR
ncbi:hypothetical protein HS041_22350 [Planomonospora sp. ID67723]|uniref:hypothetical protein n=1 Tax=Planomonospora sp. ID67723 TaxID=2738134 RepID=UPI0018C3D196|nr:hypothetical protein [Planomonospora sp. ID67723]MBG0830506.1 hypothetical protein [Planomonospora sp. ID67723]